MYVLALLLVVLGLTVQGSVDSERRDVPSALEVACGLHATHARVGVVESRPDGVLVRFTHPEGGWVMTWDGAPGTWSSRGSAMVAEMALPIPPGVARLQCYPDDLPPDSDPYHDERWSVRVHVLDAEGHYRWPRTFCSGGRLAPWHGRAFPVAREREAVMEALSLLGVVPHEGDELVPLGYAAGEPRHWGLDRRGHIVGQVTMRTSGHGTVLPDSISACTGPSAGQLSVS